MLIILKPSFFGQMQLCKMNCREKHEINIGWQWPSKWMLIDDASSLHSSTSLSYWHVFQASCRHAHIAYGVSQNDMQKCMLWLRSWKNNFSFAEMFWSIFTNQCFCSRCAVVGKLRKSFLSEKNYFLPCKQMCSVGVMQLECWENKYQLHGGALNGWVCSRKCYMNFAYLHDD